MSAFEIAKKFFTACETPEGWAGWAMRELGWA